MKAKCIMNINVESFLELGKIYDVKESPLDHQYYLVEDETGCVNAFDYYRFELINKYEVRKMKERIYRGEVHDYCSNCLTILNEGEEYIRCEVCGDLYCADCIRKNEIGEHVCVRCVEE